MERRVFLAVLLSFVVLYAYQTYFVPPTEKPPANAVTPESSQPAPPSAAASASVPSSATVPAAPAPAHEEAPPGPAPAVLVGDSQEREITVETTNLRVVFTNRGARVLHWELKHYRDNNGAMVDLVPSSLPAAEPIPFTLQAADPKDTARLNDALYRVTGDHDGSVDVAQTGTPLAFEFQDQNGLKARKEFVFDPKGYTFSVTITAQREGMPLNPAISWGAGLGDQGATAKGRTFLTGNTAQPPRALFFREGDKVRRMTSDAVTKEPSQNGPFHFVGIDDHYFTALVVNGVQGNIDYRPLTLPGAGDTQRRLLDYTVRPATAGQTLKFFVGPKQFDELQALGPDYVRAIDFGIFAWLVVPLLGTLKWIFRFTGNYGWSIILLTVIINLVMFPLRHRGSIAMRKMQIIQPQMKAIQDRYAHLKMTDPGRQKMQEEVTALYREKGVNPASGCIPMLLPFPILYAFYALLSQSIELRGAPFAAWIHDLSAADPYFVLPGLMGITMFWQQKVTPTTADPAQQKVMMIMPVMFTAMMAFSASGVVLYWFVSQLWAIGQQYLTNWIVGPIPSAAKPAGGGARRGK